MTDKPSISVALKLTGKFRSGDLKKIVHLSPTEMWCTGDKIQSTKLLRKQDGWMFAVEQRETYDVSTSLIHLLDIIDHHKDEIVLAMKTFQLDAVISVDIDLRGEAPSCRLDSTTIHRISALGANLDIDMIFTV